MKQPLYADIAFPTAVRKEFTYSVPDGLDIAPGMRVWVPLRNEKAIGMVVRVHDKKPDFKTRPVVRVLDEEPVMSLPLLKLTNWIQRFYYCSWGEAIQAALPVGLNFVSEKLLKTTGKEQHGLDEKAKEMIHEIEIGEMTLQDAERRWRDGTDASLLRKLLKQQFIEVWEYPRQKVDYKTAKHWDWPDHRSLEEVKERAKQEDRELKWVDSFYRLLDHELPELHSELIRKEGISDYTLRRLEKEGWIRSVDLPVSSDFAMNGEYRPEALKTLTDNQQGALDLVNEILGQKAFGSFLLYGVTGSGKTEVYIHALKKALEQGRGGLVLVPEIALTPQTVKRFYQIFGDQIAVLHSRLNNREKFEAWEALQSGEKRIAIGPRSAVFAPVRNPGLIIIDEEHDSSYKQFDPAPRYHARDVAIVRANLEDAVVIMGSATPSMIALRGSGKGKHELLELATRPTGNMPDVEILNMKEYRSAMRGPLTIELYGAIEKALLNNEQVILLYNRRGFASYLQCRNCGHIPQSPHCSVSLTYHKKKNMLLCHYSGYARSADIRCESCGSPNIGPMGSGTQQVEDEVERLFPEARLLRMDRDTTSGKDAHQKLYDQFLSGKADILIGTQLVAKGLDFPNVTVVGVVNADTELAFPSFRSGERMFQLLSQVAGRAGRADKPGRVYVQTWNPEHPAIRYAKTHEYKQFARKEMENRKKLNFPPFSRMIVFKFKGKDSGKVEHVAHTFCSSVEKSVGKGSVLGPSPSVIEWMMGNYHWEAHIKLDPEFNAGAIEHLLDRIFKSYDSDKPKGAGSVRINVDVGAIE